MVLLRLLVFACVCFALLLLVGFRLCCLGEFVCLLWCVFDFRLGVVALGDWC